MKGSDKVNIPAFMIDARYRPLRYLILIPVLIIIASSMVLSNATYVSASENMILEWSIYILAVFGMVFVNTWVLAPRYLLKDRLASYFISASLLVLLILIIIASMQIYVLSAEHAVEQMSTESLYLNFVSSFVSMTFLIAGTSAMKLFQYWLKSNRRISELKAATLQSELDLLKQQINPHFLFNMINNVNVLIWKNKAEAKDILIKLEDLLRYQLNDKDKEKVLLSFDIQFLNDFLNLEKIRRDKFEFTITKEGDIDDIWVPSFLFIPFVENAVKHNPDSDHQSYVHLMFSIHDNHLSFRCENSKPTGKMLKQGVGGIGLKNIQRRLTLLYPERHTLVMCDEDKIYTVTLNLDL